MHVFLSPHLDDAILSCGGTIFQLTEDSQKTVIVNVMAGDPPDPLPVSPLIRELHQRWHIGDNPIAARRHEDEAAAACLGAVSIHMSIADCVYRTADGAVLYPHGDDDLFGPVHPDDPAREQLHHTALPDLSGISHLYAPLGVGNHVDHQLVRDWAWRRIGDYRDASLRFYADYPYSHDETAVQSALDKLGKHPLIEEIILINARAVEAKIAAVAEYKSQISTFWEDLEMMREQIIESMTRTGSTPVERFWRMNTAEGACR